MNTLLQLAPPPRRVPLSLALTNIFNGAAQVGWLIFGIGMMFFWLFGGHADHSVITFRGDIEETTGRVIAVEDTNASENKQRVHANRYQYSVAGRMFTGTSYSTGTSASVGEEVTVEYRKDDPLRSRIAGMRRAIFGPFALAAGIFPAVGLVILVFGTRSGIRRTRLLRDGLLANGRFVSKEPTAMTVNKRRVYELTFEFTTRDGRPAQVKTRTNDSSRLQDEAAEPLMYDPHDPARAYLLDEVPSRPEVDGTGELIGQPVLAAVLVAVPVLVILAQAWYLLR